MIVVRQAVAGLGEALGLSEQRVDDLKTVVSEACNNVVIHAYEGEPGPLHVSAEPGADELVVTVADEGDGFKPEASSDEASLSLGLPLIASLSDGFELSGRPGKGTTTKISFSFEEKSLPVETNGAAPTAVRGTRPADPARRAGSAGPREGDRHPRCARRVLRGAPVGHGPPRRRGLRPHAR